MNITLEARKFLQVCVIKNAEFYSVIAFPSKGYFINNIICCVVNVLLTFSTIFLNGITVLAYWRSCILKKKASYFLVMILSLNDLGIGILGNSTFCVLLIRETLGYRNCALAALFVTLISALSGMSFMTLLLLNFERYLGIAYPLFHRTKVTRRRLLAAVVGLWFISAMTVCAHFIDKNVGTIIVSFTIWLSLVVVVFVYTKIFRISQRTTMIAGLGNGIVRQKGFLQKLKDARSSLIVVVCTFLCFLPMGVATALKKSNFMVIVMGLWSTMLILTASTLNSVIFFWRNKVLRSEAKKILRRVFYVSQM